MIGVKAFPRPRNRLAAATLVRSPDITSTRHEQIRGPSGCCLREQYELDSTSLTGDWLESQRDIFQSEPDILAHAGEGDVLIVFAKHSPRSEVYRKESDRLRQPRFTLVFQDAAKEYRERFLERFRRDPYAALAKLRFDASCIRNPETVTNVRNPHEITSAEIAEILFPLLLDVPLSLQFVIQRMLVDLVAPQQVLAIAIREFERKGYEGYLLAVSGLLEKYGERAWPALESLVSSERPECEYFVIGIACLKDVAADDRIRALMTLARNPDLDTRLRVVEALGRIDPEQGVPVWGVLSDDPDEEIRERAAEHLND